MLLTTHGRLEGIELADGVRAHMGIPYAAPPVGPLRFRPPEPAARWTGTRAARAFGPAATQHLMTADLRGGVPAPRIAEVSEDCLFLNVWTPPGATPGESPVLFWIHGGGLYYGSASNPLISGEHLARSTGLVVVTVNYRLGVLGGFVNVADVGDPRLGESQNLGLRDLVLALRWLRDNIEAFGGNPDAVTIAGQSAGGHCVGALLAMPDAAGLFHRAVVQSPQWLRAHDAEGPVVTEAYERAFGAPLKEGLYGSGTAQILRAQDVVVRDLIHTDVALPFVSSIQDGVLPQQILDRVSAGGAAGIPLLVGSTVDETRNMFPAVADERAEDEQFDQLAGRMVPRAPVESRDRLGSAYRQARRDLGEAPAPPALGPWFAADFMIRVQADTCWRRRPGTKPALRTSA